MLPDFSLVKQKFLEAALKFTKDRSKDDLLFSQIREHQHFEGDKMDSYAIGDETE